jgi:dienelactone hydrolase
MSQFHEIACEHDGVPLKGYFARPEGVTGPAPAVIVFPGAAGQVARMKMTVTRLAELGYVAVAAFMYDARLDTSEALSAGEQYMALLGAPELLRARTRVWFDAFAALDGVDPARLAAIGYCFGGQCVLEIARSGADVKAVVSYHGALLTHAPAGPGDIKGLVATYCGGKDAFVPVSEIEVLRAELTRAGAPFHITEFSHAQHGFTDPEASWNGRDDIVFDPLAEAVSWAGTVAILEQELG